MPFEILLRRLIAALPMDPFPVTKYSYLRITWRKKLRITRRLKRPFSRAHLPTSEKVFDLVCTLGQWRWWNETFSFIWSSFPGTWMIWSGVDSLSCGDYNAGVMAGKAIWFLLFICLKTLQSIRLACLHGFVPAGPPLRTNASKAEYNLPRNAVTLTLGLGRMSGYRLLQRLPRLLIGWANQSTIDLTLFKWLVPHLMTALWQKIVSNTTNFLLTVSLALGV